MILTTIKYSKILNVIKEDTVTGSASVNTFKIGLLSEVVSGLECFSIVSGASVAGKTRKLLESLGFEVHQDHGYGFEWETKLVCTK